MTRRIYSEEMIIGAMLLAAWALFAWQLSDVAGADDRLLARQDQHHLRPDPAPPGLAVRPSGRGRQLASLAKSEAVAD